MTSVPIRDATTVSQSEHGLIRIFQTDAPLAAEIGDSGPYDTLCAALGIHQIDGAAVQHIQTTTLDGMGLVHFLQQAYDIPEADLAAHATPLDALQGLVLIIRSTAFIDRPAKLKTDGQAKLIATFREPSIASAFGAPIDTASAQGVLSSPPPKKKPSDAAMSGRVATIALLVMALLVGLMIWVAG